VTENALSKNVFLRWVVSLTRNLEVQEVQDVGEITLGGYMVK
jgi:hypothetical protein